jgi:hypothetical protein
MGQYGVEIQGNRPQIPDRFKAQSSRLKAGSGKDTILLCFEPSALSYFEVRDGVVEVVALEIHCSSCGSGPRVP